MMTESLRLPSERQQAILAWLARDGRVLAADLAVAFTTSEDTIRRDLRDLAAAGQCRRVYGGALPLSPAARPLVERIADQPARKRALAQTMIALLRSEVPRGSLVFLDAGSTNLALAEMLPGDLGVTFATNAPSIALALSAGGSDVLMVGGRIDREVGAALGAATTEAIRRLRFGCALLGACALDAKAGLAAFHFEDAAVKRAVAEAADRLVTAATSDKLGCGAPFAVVPAPRLHHVVVEADAPPAPCAALRAAGVVVHAAARSA